MLECAEKPRDDEGELSGTVCPGLVELVNETRVRKWDFLSGESGGGGEREISGEPPVVVTMGMMLHKV
jgi:hypothetical protein